MKKIVVWIAISFSIFFVGPGYVYFKIGTFAALKAMAEMNHIQVWGSTIGLSVLAFAFFAAGRWGGKLLNIGAKSG